MPLSHVSKIFAVSDCKIAKLTADPAGGSATYATAIDVPGIKEMTLSGSVESKELRGDNVQLDVTTVPGGLTVAVSHAKLSLDVLAVLLGGTVTDSGTTPAMKAAYVEALGNTMNYFRVEGLTPSNGADSIGGDLHFTLHKCILSSYPDLGFAEEDYRIVSFEASAVYLNATGNKRMTIDINETAVAAAG
jgi:hypothetical protein